MPRVSLDLSYTHEMSPGATAPPSASRHDAAARDLTARLRCLKALVDAEREARRTTYPVTPGRVH